MQQAVARHVLEQMFRSGFRHTAPAPFTNSSEPSALRDLVQAGGRRGGAQPRTAKSQVNAADEDAATRIYGVDL